MSQPSTLRSVSRPPADSPFVAHDRAFERVLGDEARLVHLVAVDAHEGPVCVPDEDALYFTTVPVPGAEPPGYPTVAVKRVELEGERLEVDADAVSTVRADANVANGMALDLDGRLVACEQGTRARAAAITSFDRGTGSVETLVERWGGRGLNSPNDVVVKGDGTIWFTDPTYGYLQGFRPEPLIGDFVYRYDPATDQLSVVADSFDKPNGLAFSPDELTLYIGDSGANQAPASFHPSRPHHIRAFDVLDGHSLTAERLFSVTTPGFPDGIEVDTEGRVYASAASGVQVFEPSGELIGEIALPGAVNFTFGGPERNVLFVTADDAIWAAVLASNGAPR